MPYMELIDGYRVLNTAAQAIKLYTNDFDDASQNLSRIDAISGKKQGTYKTIYKGLNASDSGKLEGHRINYLTDVGPPVPTRISTNLAICCCSYFIVKDSETGNIGYTRIGTFDWNNKKELSNHLKQKLQVVVSDPITGVIPDNFTDLQDLNVTNLSSSANATSNVALQLQLPGNANVGDTYNEIINVYDSLGNQNSLNFHWSRVDNPAMANPNTTQSWQLSVTGPTGSNIASTSASPYGNSQYGMVIEFDSSGNPLAYRAWDQGNGYVAASNTPPPLQITSWGSAAKPSTIDLNLGSIGSNVGVVSTGSVFDEKKIDFNGNTQGIFTNITFDSNGYGTVAYTNGLTERYCRIPLAKCNSPNHLSARENGIFYPNYESGAMTYEYPNTNNVGELIPNALEGSTIDATQVNIEMVVAQQAFANNLAVFKAATDTLSKLNSIIA